MKRTVRLSERELKRMISESVKRVLRESQETIIFGLPLSIISENNNSITIQYNGNEYTISKQGYFDSNSRYVYIGDKYYENIGFEVSDGYAICKGDYDFSKMADTKGGMFGKLKNRDNSKDDVIEVYFPKLREILTNEELLEDSLAYYAEQTSDERQDNNILKSFLESGWSLNVYNFFSGFFFFNDIMQWKVNGVEV